MLRKGDGVGQVARVGWRQRVGRSDIRHDSSGYWPLSRLEQKRFARSPQRSMAEVLTRPAPGSGTRRLCVTSCTGPREAQGRRGPREGVRPGAPSLRRDPHRRIRPRLPRHQGHPFRRAASSIPPNATTGAGICSGLPRRRRTEPANVPPPTRGVVQRRGHAAHEGAGLVSVQMTPHEAAEACAEMLRGARLAKPAMFEAERSRRVRAIRRKTRAARRSSAMSTRRLPRQIEAEREVVPIAGSVGAITSLGCTGPPAGLLGATGTRSSMALLGRCDLRKKTTPGA